MHLENINYEIEGAIEAVLFAAGEAVETRTLAVAAECDERTVDAAVVSMNLKYEETLRGVTIVKIEDGYQLSTNLRYAENIRRCLKLEKSKPLSQTLLETLAIIAYMQPVTKHQIADIRGVDAKHAVNKLMEKGLICEKGRHEGPGKPILFGTTDEFLRKFGFHSVSDMPVMMRKFEEEAALAEAAKTSGLAEEVGIMA